MLLGGGHRSALLLGGGRLSALLLGGGRRSELLLGCGRRLGPSGLTAMPIAPPTCLALLLAPPTYLAVFLAPFTCLALLLAPPPLLPLRVPCFLPPRVFLDRRLFQTMGRALDLPFVVEVDTSNSGVGAILTQQHGDSGKLHPCAYYSRKMTAVEANYDVGNRELSSFKAALEEWQHCLKGACHYFLALTDHRNLEYLHGTKRLNPRQA
ncbi:hypothetical protein QTP86_006034 [Hemibagrus guttatus]|nr:hypothetical protein QTP86_006034 [Hemibagrus guttatus]